MKTSKTKTILIIIFVIPILMFALKLAMDSFCSMTVADNYYGEKQKEVCEITYRTIDQLIH